MADVVLIDGMDTAFVLANAQTSQPNRPTRGDRPVGRSSDAAAPAGWWPPEPSTQLWPRPRRSTAIATPSFVFSEG